jgi:hypothetical protein
MTDQIKSAEKLEDLEAFYQARASWIQSASTMADVIEFRRELDDEKKLIDYLSTSNQFERNRLLQRLLGDRQQQIESVLNAAVRASLDSSTEYQNATAEIKKNMIDERAVLLADAERGLPVRYIRSDASAHFHAEVGKAEKRLREIDKWMSSLGPNQNAGPRMLSEKRDLEAIVSEWDKTKKFCVIGERIAALRKRRKELEAIRDSIAEKFMAEARSSAA